MPSNKYDDIINLPHHVSVIHKPMSKEARAAQFSSFDALTGYKDSVKETARRTDKKIIIDEGLKNILDNKLIILKNNMDNKPEVTFKYFKKDDKKSGGEYKDVVGVIKKINTYKGEIILEDNIVLKIDDIIDIYAENLFDIW